MGSILLSLWFLINLVLTFCLELNHHNIKEVVCGAKKLILKGQYHRKYIILKIIQDLGYIRTKLHRGISMYIKILKNLGQHMTIRNFSRGQPPMYIGLWKTFRRHFEWGFYHSRGYLKK